MTPNEFKKAHPEYAHLEANDLWNAMENHMLKDQDFQEIVRPLLPFYKRYQFRWLFYRRRKTSFFRTGAHCSTRCKVCKKASSAHMVFMDFSGKTPARTICGNHDYIEEPNTSWQRKLYLAWSYVCGKFWRLLDNLHLVRSFGHDGRYGMFGDERRYVSGYRFNQITGESTIIHAKRKWWQYIIIEK